MTAFGFVLHVGWDFNGVPVFAELVFVVDVSNHLNQVDHTGEFVFGTNWHLDWKRRNVQAFLDGLNGVVEVGPHLVHLVSEDQPRNVEVVGLTPNGFSLWFNTGLGIKNGYSTVEHPEGTFNFDSEVHVSWGVDDVDPGILPNGRSSGRSDRDPTFLFFIHPVHLGSPIVGFTNLVNLTGVVQNPFSGGRLPGIDVGHDPNVTGLFKRVFTLVSHLKSDLLPCLCCYF